MLSITNPEWILAALLLWVGGAKPQQLPDYQYALPYPGLSPGCLHALNETVSCPQLLGIEARTNELLSPAQLSLLCTGECLNSLTQVRENIQHACQKPGDVIVDANIAYPATFIIDQWMLAYNLSCAKDSSTHKFCDTWLRDSSTTSPSPSQRRCSECSLKIEQLQLSFPPSYSNDSAQQFASRVASCNATGYAVSTPVKYALNQTFAMPISQHLARPPCETEYRILEGDTCSSISTGHNVSTFSLTRENHLNIFCSDLPTPGETICLPNTCDVFEVKGNQTCAEIIKAQANSITASQLRAWNPNINKDCSNINMLQGSFICVSPPGGFPAPRVRLNLNKVKVSAATIPANIQNGTETKCSEYYTIARSDKCSLLTMRFGITIEGLRSLNAGINQDCTNLTVGKAYCVKPFEDPQAPIASHLKVEVQQEECDVSSRSQSCFIDLSDYPDEPNVAGRHGVKY